MAKSMSAHDQLLLIDFSDSSSDEKTVEEQDCMNHKDDGENCLSDLSSAEDGLVSSLETTSLMLTGINSGVTQTQLTEYIKSTVKGFKGSIDQLCVEPYSYPETQRTVVNFDSINSAQIAKTNLLSWSPGGNHFQKLSVDLTSSDKESSKEQIKRKHRERQKPSRSEGSTFTLQVDDISIKKENFEQILKSLNISTYHELSWRGEAQALVRFKDGQDAASAQKKLNNCSLGGTSKKVSAFVLQPNVASIDGRQPGTHQARRGGHRNDRRPRSRGEHTRFNPRMTGHGKLDEGSHDVPYGKSNHIRPLMNIPLPVSSEPTCANDDRSSVASDFGSHHSFPMTTSVLHVTSIDARVREDGFRRFLFDNNIHYTKLELKCSRMNQRYALLHFRSGEETESSRRILNKKMIMSDGPPLYVTFNKSSARPNLNRPSGNRARANSIRDHPGRSASDCDRLSECSDMRISTASVKSCASTSNYRKKTKGNSLLVTNIGKDCDKEEFCGFLESLELVCKCSEFKEDKSTNNNTQFAVIQFENEKIAADARDTLNNEEYILGGKSRIKANFSTSHVSRGSISSESHLGDLTTLDEGINEGCVQQWLDSQRVLDDGGTCKGQGNRSSAGQGRYLHARSNRGRERRSASSYKHAGRGIYREHDDSKADSAKYNADGEGNTPGKNRDAIKRSFSTEQLDCHQATQSPELLVRDADEETIGNKNPHLPKQQGQNNPNEIIFKDLPRDITELDVVELVKGQGCDGFKDARLIKQKDTKVGSSKCFVKFSQRACAMDALLKLFGKSISGHHVHVSLSWNHKEIEPAIAKKALVSFRETEMPEESMSIQHTINQKIETINSELKNLKDSSLEDNLSFVELEICESSIEALEHQLKEQSRFRREFDAACSNLEKALHELREKRVLALADVDIICRRFERECRRAKSPLPVYGYRSHIQKLMRENKAVVLQGETGSGKSTQIPQYLVDMELQDCYKDDGGPNGKWRVVCTQPRRVAAVSLAKRVAEEYGCRVGQEIGSFVGNKKYVSASTVVTFMTDRKLLNMCMADPTLADYTCVIVDEAHERSVDTDILLATLKKLLLERSDLHLLIMSATIDIKLFTNYLGGCKELCVPGRTFPVEKIWCGDDTSIGENDYVGKAVQHAAKVHREECVGDILVFLTSANEIERACRDLASSLSQRADGQTGAVIILPLHGRLQPEEQMKVFAETEQGKRKIVFATNVAETSVTIKGIKYVIDTGVVKECQYDPKRSMSLLKVTSVTKASAEQRAGRAGRTCPGVCYRLYNEEEYSQLEETTKPEILRVHLGMAALQLLELGVEDVGNFDFIQSPDREAMHQAMTTLRLLGGVDTKAKLTSMGRKMATLSLEPRLSKLVLEGVERGVTMEAVIIAALVSAPGSIFYRGGSEKDKEKADRLKLKFCHESSDILTMLHAYGQWNNQPEKQQNAWCMENSMNSKTLRATKETVKEITQVLQREHNIGCNSNDYKMGILDKELSEKLQKIIMSAYFQTLSLYNGHPRAGYTVLLQQKSAHIHPSSAHNALDSNPKWVVYEEFKRTSRDFLFNVTQVNITWLKEVAPAFSREIELEKLQEMAMEELIPPIPLGTALMRQLTMKRNEKLRILEENIPNQEKAPCIIVVDHSTKELRMFVNKEHGIFASSYVHCVLDFEREQMKREQKEVSVGESKAVRQVVVAGVQTKFILMAKDYRALEISNMPDDDGTYEDDVGRVSRVLSCSKNDILEVYQFPQHSTMAKAGKWGRVTFLSPEIARKAKQKMDDAVSTVNTEETSLIITPIQGRGFQRRDIQQVNSRLVITWETWPSKGHAFVNCASSDDAFTLTYDFGSRVMRGSNMRCKIQRNKTQAIIIQDVSPDVIQEELENLIKGVTNISFTKCTIVRAPPSEPIPRPDEVKRDIYHMLNNIVAQEDINIDVLPPRSEKTQTHKAIVTFTGDDYEGAVEDRVAYIQLNTPRNSAGQIYRVKITASCILFCNPHIYSCLEEEINKLVETAQEEQQGLNIRVSRSKKKTDWVISISGKKMKDVNMLRQSLLEYIKGETIALTDLTGEQMPYQKRNSVMDILHKTGIKHLLSSLDAHATIDTRRQAIVIYGKDQIRTELKKQLGAYVDNICMNKLRDIPLTEGLSEQCSKGRAIRALVKAYGPYLKTLQDNSKAKQILLNTRQGVLLVEGDQGVFDTVHGMVRSCLKEAGLERAIGVGVANATEDVECGICFTSVEGKEEVFRLSACSHGFHLECLTVMFNVKLQSASKDYPIECPYDDCGAAMLLCDIHILCRNENKRLRLYELALEAHVMQKCNNQVKFCPSPNCKMIYKVTADPQTLVCPECRSRLCSSCGKEAHPGITCLEFKKYGKTFDDIELWMRNSGKKNVKKCPVPDCGIFIEKVYGCNNMTCHACKQYICWICLAFFKSSEKCYNHLTMVHGGCF